jgi:hypothetical protein
VQAQDAERVCGRQLVGTGEGAADGAGYGGHGNSTAPSSSRKIDRSVGRLGEWRSES